MTVPRSVKKWELIPGDTLEWTRVPEPRLRYVRAHGRKWALYGGQDFIGWVYKMRQNRLFYYRLIDDMHWHGPYVSKALAGEALIGVIEGGD